MHVDHVAVGWDDLTPLTDALADVSLPFDEGGTHADETTHMALTGFPDGSYLEYIAPTAGTDPLDAGFWPDALAERAGPAAWAVRVDDVVGEAKRALDAGVAIEGPFHGGRTRPDGRRVEWDQVFERVDSADRWLSPFPIADRTPREWRVAETAELTALTGIETVVLGVESHADANRFFDRRYRTPAPVSLDTDALTGEVTTVPGFPLAFASASADRIDRVGERPLAVLLGTDDLPAAQDAYRLTDPVAWGDQRVAWFDHPVFEKQVGVVG